MPRADGAPRGFRSRRSITHRNREQITGHQPRFDAKRWIHLNPDGAPNSDLGFDAASDFHANLGSHFDPDVSSRTNTKSNPDDQSLSTGIASTDKSVGDTGRPKLDHCSGLRIHAEQDGHRRV